MKKRNFLLLLLIFVVTGISAQTGIEETKTAFQTIAQVVSWLLAFGAIGILYAKFPKLQAIINKALSHAASSSVDLNNVAIQATEATNALVDFVAYVNDVHRDGTITKEEQEKVNELGSNLIKEFKDVPASIKELVEKLKGIGK